MLMESLKFILVFTVCATASNEEIDNFLIDFDKILRACASEWNVPYDSIDAKLSHLTQGIANTDAECFLACVFKQNDLINNRGLIFFHNFSNFTSRIWSDSLPKQVVLKTQEYATSCGRKVNAAKIRARASTNKMCARAALMYTCMNQMERDKGAPMRFVIMDTRNMQLVAGR